jgi:phytoene desaturase
MKKVAIIGSGFSSLSAACYLAKAGFDVDVFEKNSSIGGRARQLKKDGFTFDMGPTWYWMPDVFERFFADFGKNPSDYYQLEKLNPAYKVFFGKNDVIEIGNDLEKIKSVFEAEESGSAEKLEKFIARARENYEIAIKDLVYRPGVSPLELISPKTINKMGRFFGNISADVKKDFKSEKLIRILEFPALFLGAKASDTPSFYSFMNYADFGLGTWHPKGGMFEVVQAMEKLAVSLGVKIHLNQNVEKILVEQNSAKGILTNVQKHEADTFLSGADYHHTESLLDKNHRQYSENYWNKKAFAPSALLFYVGFNKKLENVSHHNLFFDVDFEAHANAVYKNPKWPEKPMFYASFPSKTDEAVAPDGKETGIFLIPLAPGLEDDEGLRKKYFDKIMERFEKLTNNKVRDDMQFMQSYCINDFIQDYNSYKGNAYGLANTLLQTAFLRPKLKSKKTKNLYFTGQLTVPGPGVPPSLISGKLVSELILKHHKTPRHEIAI